MMADYGTIAVGPTLSPVEVTAFQAGTGADYGTLQIRAGQAVIPVAIDAYGIGGTTAPPSAPTIGQLWPLGTTAQVAAMTETYPVIVNSFSIATTAAALPGRDYVYIATAAPVTLTLPTAAGNTSRYTVKNTASSGAVTVATTSSQTIDGASTYSLATQYLSTNFVSDGANWVVWAT